MKMNDLNIMKKKKNVKMKKKEDIEEDVLDQKCGENHLCGGDLEEKEEK